MGAGMPPPCLHGALGLGCAGLGGPPGTAGPLGLNPNCLMSVLRMERGGREGGNGEGVRGVEVGCEGGIEGGMEKEC